MTSEWPWHSRADGSREGRSGSNLALSCLHPAHSAVHSSGNGPLALPYSISRQVDLDGAFALPACTLSLLSRCLLLLPTRQHAANPARGHCERAPQESVSTAFFFQLLVFLLFPSGRENSDRKKWWKLGPVVYHRNSHRFSHLCTLSPVQCGLADPLIQRWPLFLYLLHLGWPCDPGAWLQQRLESIHARTRCLAALGTLRPPHEQAWASLLDDERCARGKVIPIVLSQFWDMWMRSSLSIHAPLSHQLAKDTAQAPQRSGKWPRQEELAYRRMRRNICLLF